jgi:rRNA-processing protein FCF1
LAITSNKGVPLRVIMDSNAFFIPFQFKIDIFSELDRLLGGRYELILLPQVKKELEALVSKGSPKTRKTVNSALKLAATCKRIEIEVQEPYLVDDVIFEASRQLGAAVFTNDRHLKKRLRDISVPVIYQRQKSRLSIDGLV